VRQQLEGSQAVAEAVARCRPQVVAAYPITPQTHIIERLAQNVADGELAAEFISAESEFAAASIVLGAVAAGSRAFTASASQGLLLMTEVLFNIAGLRLPVVMVCANRAVSAPINIFSDHQDSMALRDTGWIQLYVESNQEALDTVIQAYRIAERCELPVMVCMDGFLLTHTFEPVELPEQDAVDAFLPAFRFARSLDPARPLTLGGGSEPDNYQEYRAAQHRDLLAALGEIEGANEDYAHSFGRAFGNGLLDPYRLDDAETVLLTLGSVSGAARDAVDRLRERGEPVGLLRLRCFRPFPAEALVAALAGARRIVVFEKALGVGAGGIVATELRAALHHAGWDATVGRGAMVESFVGGLGGRDVTAEIIASLFRDTAGSGMDCRFVGLNEGDDQ